MSLPSSWLPTLRRVLALLALCSAGLVPEPAISTPSPGLADPAPSSTPEALARIERADRIAL